MALIPTYIEGPSWTDGELNEDFPREVAWDEFGIASGAAHYNCKFAMGQSLVSAITAHPDFDFMPRKTAVMRREMGGLAKVQINFVGIEDAKQGHFYSTKASTSLQPIETHPKFKSDIGGYGANGDSDYPQNTKNGAKFDKEGKFLGFITAYKIPFGLAVIANPLAGVRSYYAPTVTYEQTSILGASFSVNDIADNLGKIDDPPNGPSGIEGSGEGGDGDLPVISTVDNEVRNWLKLGADVSPIGRGHRRVSRWLLSGPRGWNTIVYGDADGEITGEVEV